MLETFLMLWNLSYTDSDFTTEKFEVNIKGIPPQMVDDQSSTKLPGDVEFWMKSTPNNEVVETSSTELQL